MVSAGQNAWVYKDQDETIRFTIAEDVTGWTLTYEVRDGDGTGSVIITITESSMTINADTTSTIDVPLTDAQLTIDVGGYWHSLMRTNAGLEKPLAVGTLHVLGWAHAI